MCLLELVHAVLVFSCSRRRTGGFLMTRSWLTYCTLLLLWRDEGKPSSVLSPGSVMAVNVNSLQALGFNQHADLFDVLSREPKEGITQPA